MNTEETSNLIDQEKMSIIGAGASGYFLALELLKKGFAVDLYDQTGGALKKFLIAGKGGLNLTHTDELSVFAAKYGKHEKLFKKLISQFSTDDLRTWFNELGVETYVGSSKRVFPKDTSAGDILRTWTDRCHAYSNFTFYSKHQFIDYEDGIVLKNEEKELINLGKKNIILALGGASYKHTGSDATWMDIFEKMEIDLKPFSPVNCGFEVEWSQAFIDKCSHQPLKNIKLKYNNFHVRGELLITDYGVEGSGIYALSRQIQESIGKNGKCVIGIDLKPDISIEEIKTKLQRAQNKNSFSNFLRKTLNLDSVSLELLKSVSSKTDFQNLELLPNLVKNCSLVLLKARPIDEAISTRGGVVFDEVEEDFTLKKYPGITVMGEMLDWDVQTGGYLFQGCFSMASWIASHIKTR